jgi:hypothetical protein
MTLPRPGPFCPALVFIFLPGGVNRFRGSRWAIPFLHAEQGLQRNAVAGLYEKSEA